MRGSFQTTSDLCVAALTLRRPRRIEMTCSAHKALVTDLTNRLDALKGRPSADPSDPLIMQLEEQLRALGPVPRRLGPR